MYMNKNLSLLLAGVAAYGFYKYNKLTETQKRELADNLKQKGKKLYDQYVPDNLKKELGKIS